MRLDQQYTKIDSAFRILPRRRAQRLSDLGVFDGGFEILLDHREILENRYMLAHFKATS